MDWEAGVCEEEEEEEDESLDDEVMVPPLSGEEDFEGDDEVQRSYGAWEAEEETEEETEEEEEEATTANICKFQDCKIHLQPIDTALRILSGEHHGQIPPFVRYHVDLPILLASLQRFKLYKQSLAQSSASQNFVARQGHAAQHMTVRDEQEAPMDLASRSADAAPSRPSAAQVAYRGARRGHAGKSGRRMAMPNETADSHPATHSADTALTRQPVAQVARRARRGRGTGRPGHQTSAASRQTQVATMPQEEVLDLSVPKAVVTPSDDLHGLDLSLPKKRRSSRDQETLATANCSATRGGRPTPPTAVHNEESVSCTPVRRGKQTARRGRAGGRMSRQGSRQVAEPTQETNTEPALDLTVPKTEFTVGHTGLNLSVTPEKISSIEQDGRPILGTINVYGDTSKWVTTSNVRGRNKARRGKKKSSALKPGLIGHSSPVKVIAGTSPACLDCPPGDKSHITQGCATVDEPTKRRRRSKSRSKSPSQNTSITEQLDALFCVKSPSKKHKKKINRPELHKKDKCKTEDRPVLKLKLKKCKAPGEYAVRKESNQETKMSESPHVDQFSETAVDKYDASKPVAESKVDVDQVSVDNDDVNKPVAGSELIMESSAAEGRSDSKLSPEDDAIEKGLAVPSKFDGNIGHENQKTVIENSEITDGGISSEHVAYVEYVPPLVSQVSESGDLTVSPGTGGQVVPEPVMSDTVQGRDDIVEHVTTHQGNHTAPLGEQSGNDSDPVTTTHRKRDVTPVTTHSISDASAITTHHGGDAAAVTTHRGSDAAAVTTHRRSDAAALTKRRGSDAAAVTMHRGSDAAAVTTHRGSDAAVVTTHRGSDAAAVTTHQGSDAAAVTTHRGSDAAAVTTHQVGDAAAVTTHRGHDAAVVTTHRGSDAAAVTTHQGSDAAAVTTHRGSDAAAVTTPQGSDAAAMTTAAASLPRCVVSVVDCLPLMQGARVKVHAIRPKIKPCCRHLWRNVPPSPKKKTPPVKARAAVSSHKKQPDTHGRESSSDSDSSDSNRPTRPKICKMTFSPIVDLVDRTKPPTKKSHKKRTARKSSCSSDNSIDKSGLKSFPSEDSGPEKSHVEKSSTLNEKNGLKSVPSEVSGPEKSHVEKSSTLNDKTGLKSVPSEVSGPEKSHGKKSSTLNDKIGLKSVPSEVSGPEKSHGEKSSTSNDKTGLKSVPSGVTGPEKSLGEKSSTLKDKTGLKSVPSEVSGPKKSHVEKSSTLNDKTELKSVPSEVSGPEKSHGEKSSTLNHAIDAAPQGRLSATDKSVPENTVLADGPVPALDVLSPIPEKQDKEKRKETPRKHKSHHHGKKHEHKKDHAGFNLASCLFSNDQKKTSNEQKKTTSKTKATGKHDAEKSLAKSLEAGVDSGAAPETKKSLKFKKKKKSSGSDAVIKYVSPLDSILPVMEAPNAPAANASAFNAPDSNAPVPRRVPSLTPHMEMHDVQDGGGIDGPNEPSNASSFHDIMEFSMKAYEEEMQNSLWNHHPDMQVPFDNSGPENLLPPTYEHQFLEPPMESSPQQQYYHQQQMGYRPDPIFQHDSFQDLPVQHTPVPPRSPPRTVEYKNPNDPRTLKRKIILKDTGSTQKKFKEGDLKIVVSEDIPTPSTSSKPSPKEDKSLNYYEDNVFGDGVGSVRMDNDVDPWAKYLTKKDTNVPKSAGSGEREEGELSEDEEEVEEEGECPAVDNMPVSEVVSDQQKMGSDDEGEGQFSDDEMPSTAALKFYHASSEEYADVEQSSASVYSSEQLPCSSQASENEPNVDEIIYSLPDTPEKKRSFKINRGGAGSKVNSPQFDAMKERISQFLREVRESHKQTVKDGDALLDPAVREELQEELEQQAAGGERDGEEQEEQAGEEQQAREGQLAEEEPAGQLVDEELDFGDLVEEQEAEAEVHEEPAEETDCNRNDAGDHPMALHQDSAEVLTSEPHPEDEDEDEDAGSSEQAMDQTTSQQPFGSYLDTVDGEEEELQEDEDGDEDPAAEAEEEEEAGSDEDDALSIDAPSDASFLSFDDDRDAQKKPSRKSGNLPASMKTTSSDTQIQPETTCCSEVDTTPKRPIQDITPGRPIKDSPITRNYAVASQYSVKGENDGEPAGVSSHASQDASGSGTVKTSKKPPMTDDMKHSSAVAANYCRMVQQCKTNLLKREQIQRLTQQIFSPDMKRLRHFIEMVREKRPRSELTIHDKRNIAQMSLALMLGCRKKEQWTAGFEIISVLVREDIKLYWLASNQQLTECEILYAMLHVCIRSGHQIEAGKLLIDKKVISEEAQNSLINLAEVYNKLMLTAIISQCTPVVRSMYLKNLESSRVALDKDVHSNLLSYFHKAQREAEVAGDQKNQIQLLRLAGRVARDLFPQPSLSAVGQGVTIILGTSMKRVEIHCLLFGLLDKLREKFELRLDSGNGQPMPMREFEVFIKLFDDSGRKPRGSREREQACALICQVLESDLNPPVPVLSNNNEVITLAVAKVQEYVNHHSALLKQLFPESASNKAATPAVCGPRPDQRSQEPECGVDQGYSGYNEDPERDHDHHQAPVTGAAGVNDAWGPGEWNPADPYQEWGRPCSYPDYYEGPMGNQGGWGPRRPYTEASREQFQRDCLLSQNLTRVSGRGGRGRRGQGHPTGYNPQRQESQWPGNNRPPVMRGPPTQDRPRPLMGGPQHPDRPRPLIGGPPNHVRPRPLMESDYSYEAGQWQGYQRQNSNGRGGLGAARGLLPNPPQGWRGRGGQPYPRTDRGRGRGRGHSQRGISNPSNSNMAHRLGNQPHWRGGPSQGHREHHGGDNYHRGDDSYQRELEAYNRRGDQHGSHYYERDLDGLNHSGRSDHLTGTQMDLREKVAAWLQNVPEPQNRRRDPS